MFPALEGKISTTELPGKFSYNFLRFWVLLYHWLYKKVKFWSQFPCLFSSARWRGSRPGKTLQKVWKKGKRKQKGDSRESCPGVPMILPTDLWGTESCSDTGVFSVRIWWIAALALHTWTGKPLISSTRSSPISSVSTSIRAPVFFLSCREKDTWQNVLEELLPGSAKGTLNLALGVDELDTAISEIGCHKQSSIICTYGRRDKGNPKQQLIQNRFSVFRLVFPQIWIKESIILFPWHSNWIMEDGKNNQGAINLLLPINEFIIPLQKGMIWTIPGWEPSN